MFKQKYAFLFAFCITLVAVCLLSVNTCAQSQETDNEELRVAAIGREDPFGQLQTNKPAAKQVPITDDKEESSPELFLETVHIEFLDAQSLKELIQKMLSANGSISIDGKSNSLIIWDTAENLDMILTQIQRADRQLIPQRAVIREVNEPELYVEAKLLSSPAEKTSHPLFRESPIHIGSRSDSTGFLEGFGGYVIEKMHVF